MITKFKIDENYCYNVYNQFIEDIFILTLNILQLELFYSFWFIYLAFIIFKLETKRSS